MRRLSILSTAVLAGFLAVGVAGVATADKDGDAKLDGRKLFKEYCKPCHAKGSENGEYTPMSLIQDQWEEFFEDDWQDTHGDVVDPHHGGKKVTEEITPEMFEAIKTFAIEHAADSEHPMTCG